MASPGEIFLNPGDFCFTSEETRLHAGRRLGGMCHYMNPTRGHPSENEELDGRYADEAMRMFLRELSRCGTWPQEYEVKMFGGGNQFPDAPTPPALDVSRGNVAAGLRLLREHGFSLTTVHLGGTGYRRLELDVPTGAVQLIHVHQADSAHQADAAGRP